MGRGPRVGAGALPRSAVRGLLGAISTAESGIGEGASAGEIEDWIRRERPQLYEAWCACVRDSGARQVFIRRHRARKPTPKDVVTGISELFPPDIEHDPIRFGDEFDVFTKYDRRLTGSADPRESWQVKQWAPVVRWGLTAGLIVSPAVAILLPSPVLWLVPIGLLMPVALIWDDWRSWRRTVSAEVVKVRVARPSSRGASFEMRWYRRDGRAVLTEHYTDAKV